LNVASAIEVKYLKVDRCSKWFNEVKLGAWNNFWDELFERDRVGRRSKYYIPKHFFVVTGEVHFNEPSGPSPSTLMYDERRNGSVLSVVTTPEEAGEMPPWHSTFYKVIFSLPVFQVPKGQAKNGLEESSFYTTSLTRQICETYPSGNQKARSAYPTSWKWLGFILRCQNENVQAAFQW